MKYILFILIAGSLFLSCRKSDLQGYSEKPRIYFNLNKVQFYGSRPGSSAGDVLINFAPAISAVTTDTLFIRVAVTGPAASADRQFKFSRNTAAGDAREGDDFEILNSSFVIAAGKYDSVVEVVVHRTSPMAQKEVSFGFMLEANENFQLGPQGDTATFSSNNVSNTMRICQLQVTARDIVTKPANWETFIKNYFGDYSEVKYRFVIDVLKQSEFASTTSARTMNRYKTQLNTALTEYNATHSEPLKDENGNPVTF